MPSIPQERQIKHRFKLLPANTPPSKQQRTMSPSELAKVYHQFDEYLSKGLVHPSKSPYGVPILFGWKKDMGLHVYLNYWVLN